MATSDNVRIEADRVALLRYAGELFELQKTKKEFGPIWNGRQICNAFQSAVALAGFKKEPGEPINLLNEHFEKVSMVSNHFNNYLWRVKRSLADADMARMNMLRVDDYVLGELPQLPQHVMQPEQNNALLRATLGQKIQRGFTPVPTPGVAIPHLPPQQPPYSMNIMVPGQSQQLGNLPGYAPQFTQGLGVRPQYQAQQQQFQVQQQHFQAQQQQRQPVFTQPTILNNVQQPSNMQIQAPYRLQQPQQQQGQQGNLEPLLQQQGVTQR